MRRLSRPCQPSKKQQDTRNACDAGERMPIHFVIDTGMGRIGSSEEEADQVFRAIRAMPQLQVTALSSHLPVADEDENYTARQLERFRAIAARLLA